MKRMKNLKMEIEILIRKLLFLIRRLLFLIRRTDTLLLQQES